MISRNKGVRLSIGSETDSSLMFSAFKNKNVEPRYSKAFAIATM